MSNLGQISDTDIANFREFKSYVQRFGFSLSNFYDVDFLLTNSSTNLQDIFSRIPGGNSKNINDPQNVRGLMKLYAEECTIPGYQISTGDFRINNSPTMKYGYGIVNNEITFSFICDAMSEIRKTFDAWQTYIYTHVASLSSTNLILNPNSVSQLGRTRYKDEYVTDIIVKKYERYAASKELQVIKDETNIAGLIQRFHPVKDIIPDSPETKYSGFGKAQAVYSIRLKNAFPTNISSMSLSSGSSQLLKLQVTFEYDLALSSAVSGGSVVSGDYQTVSV